MRPVAETKGHDRPGLFDEIVPGVAAIAIPDNPVERIRQNLVALRLRMPHVMEAFDTVIQQLKSDQVGAIEAIDTLLAEEVTVRQGRRIKAALQMPRLATVKIKRHQEPIQRVASR